LKEYAQDIRDLKKIKIFSVQKLLFWISAVVYSCTKLYIRNNIGN